MFVVEEGKAVQRKVNTGIEEGDRVQVLSGLHVGEKVIVKGHEKIKDGTAVRIPKAARRRAMIRRHPRAVHPALPRKERTSETVIIVVLD